MKWREFRFIRKGQNDLLWMIAQDGERYHTKHGQVGGVMQESSDRPGDKGVPDTKSYVNAEDNCFFHLNREIRKKTEHGYIEYVDGQPTQEQITELSFKDFLPKNFCSYKPQKSITDKALAALAKKKNDRYTRKVDGMQHVACHHPWGWEIYTRRMDVSTERFPNHVKELESLSHLAAGTILVGEMACFKTDGTDDFKGISRICRSKPHEARDLVNNGEVVEPVFIVFDCLFHNEKDLSNHTYDDRSKLWKTLPAYEEAKKTNKLVSSVDYYDLTPNTWEKLCKEKGWEGFVVTDGSAKPGDKFYSFNGKAKRPKGHHKLKPLYEDDVVIYAGLQGTGKRLNGIGSVFVKQKHPDTGEWFSCGKVGSGFTEQDLEELESLFRKNNLPIVSKDKEVDNIDIQNNNGLVMMLEYSERQPGTNKFRFPVFSRLRDDKFPEECEAQRLSPDEE